ncbi:MAG: efflux RND transporter periplasmic adaptor subunit [Candidatus Eremiobacteraeota bacterium]|nr:efflux RND transporter periplasmic adaptor subunit [Candidatus Eremiobacteraeota bacterium]
MNTRRRNILIVIGAFVLLLLVAVLAGKARHSDAATVKEQTVKFTTFTTKLPENGVVQRPRTQTLAAQISGNLGNISVRAGDYVTEGQLLATISNPQIINGAQGGADAYRAAVARAQSSTATTRTNVVQAQANLESARARLTQAQQDVANGSQSGLGYGGSTAADQRVNADAALSNASTNLREARRLYAADQDLLNQKAVSRDQVDQQLAKLQQAQTAYAQAKQQRESLNGQLSRSGQVLQQNLRSAQESYAQAQAALAAAQVQTGGGDVAAANAEAAKAASDYQYAQSQANNTQIRAPFSGTILSVASQAGDALRPIQPGDAVAIGQTIFTLAADDAFIVRTKVDEQDIINVRLGQRAQITGEDFPGRTLSGHVMAISPIAQKSDDPSSSARQIITTIRLDSSPSFLRDGMSVDVDVLTTNVTHTIVVSNDAIVKDGKKRYVYVVQKGNAHKVPVRVGQSNDSQSVIISGLKAEDVIIAEKPVAISEGASVAAAPSASPSKSP